MRNCVDSEVKNLKDLPVTNALFDPLRVQVRMASSGFYTDHRIKAGRALDFLYFPRHRQKEREEGRRERGRT